MSDVLVFALIGALAGAAARLWYPGREAAQILGTMLVGVAGLLLGWVVPWSAWPVVEGQPYTEALLTSLLVAVLTLSVWPCAVYARTRSGATQRAR